MGVRHLITFLRPYASAELLAKQKVVIDGPAFAYHVYYSCLGARIGSRNSLEAALSYEEVGVAALAWLERLRESQATVMMIYFDGFLPASKFRTRIQRLIQTSHQLLQFHEQNLRPARVSSARQKKILPTSSKNNSESPGSKRANAPPIPFLVPAVIEALLNSNQYRDIVEVSPGEADLYCAKYLQQHGGLIFTGDSDLLVHDLGPDGGVTFFSDLDEFPNDGSIMQTRIFKPAEIATRLRIPDKYGISAIAFESNMDPSAAFSSILPRARICKCIKTHPTTYASFAKEYASLPELHLPDDEKSKSIRSILQSLDPRISELVLQFPTLAKIAGQLPSALSSDTQTSHIFLPFLIDSPIRRNAWEISTSIRQLSYSLLNLLVPTLEQKATIFEHRNQVDKSNGRELQLPSPITIPTACHELIQTLSQLQTKYLSLNSREFWIGVSVHQDISWSDINSKPPLTQEVIAQIILIPQLQDLSWDVVQFYSQIQGTYYSFRILKQIINLISASGLITEDISLLKKELETLPLLKDLQDFSHVKEIVQMVDRMDMIQASEEILGIKSLPLVGKSQTVAKTSDLKGKRKRVNERESEEVDVNRTMKSSNPFDLLAVDW